LEGMSWIHLAQDRDQLRALVNTVMNLYVPWKARSFLTEWRLAFQGRLYSMRLVG
jgi:hypothetical protein